MTSTECSVQFIGVGDVDISGSPTAELDAVEVRSWSLAGALICALREDERSEWYVAATDLPAPGRTIGRPVGSREAAVQFAYNCGRY